MNILLVVAFLSQTFAFVNNQAKPYRLAPVHENFFFDVAEDPAINTPRQIFGEVKYKSFVESYNPNGLIVGGSRYNIIERLRALKLLKLTAESGLLETLEAKGLTLSKLEALLPLADNLGLLPLLTQNKDTVLSVAPLIIEPAPVLLPLVVSLLKTSPITFIGPGLALLGLGVFEATDNLLLGAPLVLAGFPLVATGGVLSAVSAFLAGPAPTFAASAASVSSSPTPVSRNRPVAKARPAVRAAPALPGKRTSGTKAAAPAGGSMNGKRKLIKVKAKR